MPALKRSPASVIIPFIAVSLSICLTNPYCCIEHRHGEAKEMKKALLCDTLSASIMIHQLQSKTYTDCQLAAR